MTMSKTFLNLFDYYSFTNSKDVVVSYKGPVTEVIMAEISRDIREKLSDHPTAGRRLFSVFIELAQNVLYYSAEKITFSNRNDSVGILLLTKQDGQYVFSSGNLIKNSDLDELVSSCQKINSLDRDDLRKFKREMRNQPAQSEKSKGAGIGLIHVALTSRHPLELEHRKIDEEHSFFALSVKIKRDQPAK